jgi:hypothetical protein
MYRFQIIPESCSRAMGKSMVNRMLRFNDAFVCRTVSRRSAPRRDVREGGDDLEDLDA